MVRGWKTALDPKSRMISPLAVELTENIPQFHALDLSTGFGNPCDLLPTFRRSRRGQMKWHFHLTSSLQSVSSVFERTID